MGSPRPVRRLPSKGVNATAPPVAGWRLRDWPGDPTIGHLIFVDHARVPSPGEVAHALDRARHQGKRAVRTSALFPASAAVLDSMGFVAADRLALLRLDAFPERARVAPTATRALRSWHRAAAARVDQAAFGLDWGNDVTGLVDISRATPVHRARWLGRPAPRRELVAFSISGAAGTTGYLQRVAVHPDHRRQGLAATLVADALAWMRARRLESVLVNTGVANTAALALYTGFGFVRLSDELVVAEYRFAGPA